ncbi:MAG: DUF3078 domain-containing protein [Bacteroidota bacterium]
MLKTVSGLFFVACLYFTIPAVAQKTDSLKRADSLRVDTNLLNKYRIEPRRNGIPIRVKPAIIREEQIPVSLMDYKINYWRKWITFGINLNQSAFSGNWAAGGISSLAIGGNFDYKTEYNKSPFDYVGELMALYGRVTNKGQVARKTNDRLFFDNKIATQLSKKWFFFGSLTFESQFDKGYQYPTTGAPILISSLMSPGYLTESFGIEYKPNKVFDLRIGTGTARQTFVLDTTIYHVISSNYGVTPGKTFKNELAFQIVSTYAKDIMPNLNLSARYAGFIPYGRGLINIDHRLDAILIAKVNRLINVNVTGTLLFDNDTSTKPQSTEGLALGIIYKFPY